MVYGKYIHDYVPNAVIILMIIDSWKYERSQLICHPAKVNLVFQ